MQQLFSAVGGFPCPLLPFDAAGVERTADGVAVFSLDQAIARWGKGDELQQLWRRHYDEALSPHGGGDSRTRDLATMRRTEYRQLTDGEFAQYLDVCKAKQLDPLERPIYPVWNDVGNNGRKQLEWRYPISTMLTIADRQGNFAGIDEPKTIYSDENERIPFNSSVTVYKFDTSGRKVSYTGRAAWLDYYPGPGTFFDRMPTLKLGYCATALALRLCYPGPFRNVYAPEEMKQAEIERPMSLEWDHIRQASWPASLTGLHTALSEIGIKDTEKREKIIAALRMKVGHPAVDDDFYRLALQALYRKPADYEVELPTVEN